VSVDSEEVRAVRSFKRWLDRSLTAQAVVVFPMGVGFAALFRRHEHPVLWVILGALYTAVTLAFLAVQRRRTCRAVGTDPGEIADLNRKIRHREVPKDPGEQATMRRLVAEQLGQMERGGRWLPYWLGAMGLIAAGLLALGAVTGSLTFPLVFAVGVAGFCYWVLWMRRHAMDRVRFMHSALRNQGERVS
jgi:Flp pilus assembly protein TadB